MSTHIPTEPTALIFDKGKLIGCFNNIYLQYSSKVAKYKNYKSLSNVFWPRYSKLDKLVIYEKKW